MMFLSDQKDRGMQVANQASINQPANSLLPLEMMYIAANTGPVEINRILAINFLPSELNKLASSMMTKSIVMEVNELSAIRVKT